MLLVPPTLFTRPVAAEVAPPTPATVVEAALVALSRSGSFKTVTTSPSLDEVTLVEPRAHAATSTSHILGPAGRGVLRVVVTGGSEYLEGDANGLGDLLRLLHAPAHTLALARSLAGTWLLEPATSVGPVDGFGPSLTGIGHVFCTGAGCTLAGAKVVAEPPGELVVDVPAFGGDLVLDTTHRFRPLALIGTGARQGLVMRLAYPTAPAPPIDPPGAFLPAPAAFTS